MNKLITATKNSKTITCSLHCDKQKADLLFHDMSVSNIPLSAAGFSWFVILVPYSLNCAAARLQTKAVRAAYGVDRCFLMDVDETYVLHRRLGLLHDEVADTKALAEQYLLTQGYEVQYEGKNQEG